MKEIFETKVTTINGRHHCRVLFIESGKVFDETVCRERIDIRYCFAHMFRMAAKCGWLSPMAIASRKRNFCDPSKKPLPKPVGVIKWKQHFDA